MFVYSVNNAVFLYIKKSLHIRHHQHNVQTLMIKTSYFTLFLSYFICKVKHNFLSVQGKGMNIFRKLLRNKKNGGV